MHDVHPKTFKSKGGGRWGFYIAKWAKPRAGFFGEIHMVKSRLRTDSIVHELEHARVEWMWSNGFTITRLNEEKMTELLDELVRKFHRELRKLGIKIKL